MHAILQVFSIIYWTHLLQTLYGCGWGVIHTQHTGVSTKTVHSRMIISWFVILIQAPLLTWSINVLKPNVNVNDWAYGGRVKLQDLKLIGDRYFLNKPCNVVLGAAQLTGLEFVLQSAVMEKQLSAVTSCHGQAVISCQTDHKCRV